MKGFCALHPLLKKSASSSFHFQCVALMFLWKQTVHWIADKAIVAKSPI